MLLTLVLHPVSSQSDIWHDPYAPAWIGIMLGIIAIAVAIWSAMYQVRKQREKKEITYQRISEAPIVTVNNDIASRVEVLLDGKPAKEVRLVVFEVKNVGYSAVKGEDYFEPLIFHFDNEVVGGEVLKTKPNEFLEPSRLASFLTFKGKAVQLSACPLNPGDAITFSVFIEGEGQVDVRGRINTGEIREFDPIRERERQQKRLRRLYGLMTTITLLLVAPGIIYLSYKTVTTNTRPVVISGVLALMMLGGFILYGITVFTLIILQRVFKKG